MASKSGCTKAIKVEVKPLPEVSIASAGLYVKANGVWAISIVGALLVLSGCGEVGGVRTLVTRPPVSDSEWCQRNGKIREQARSLTPEDCRWLMKTASTDKSSWVRANARRALMYSGKPTAAFCLYRLAVASERRKDFEACVRDLGAMGAAGNPYLLRLVEERGVSQVLLVAIAQSEGVEPAPALTGGKLEWLHYSSQGYAEWWDAVGKERFGDAVTSETPLSELIQMAQSDLFDQRVNAAWWEIKRRKDPNCVPLLLDALHDRNIGDVEFGAYELIAELGDGRCLPFLVPIADRYLDVEMTGELYLGMKGGWESLWARRCLYFLVNPKQRERWKEVSLYMPRARTPTDVDNSEGFKVDIKSPYDRVNAWYRLWRSEYDHTKAAGYRKAVDVWGTTPPRPVRYYAQHLAAAAKKRQEERQEEWKARSRREYLSSIYYIVYLIDGHVTDETLGLMRLNIAGSLSRLTPLMRFVIMVAGEGRQLASPGETFVPATAESRAAAEKFMSSLKPDVNADTLAAVKRSYELHEKGKGTTDPRRQYLYVFCQGDLSEEVATFIEEKRSDGPKVVMIGVFLWVTKGRAHPNADRIAKTSGVRVTFIVPEPATALAPTTTKK